MSAEGVKSVKTSIFFTTYENGVAEELIREISEKYEVIESGRSKVVEEMYYVFVKGDAKDIEDLLGGRVLWFKVDVLVFK